MTRGSTTIVENTSTSPHWKGSVSRGLQVSSQTVAPERLSAREVSNRDLCSFAAAGLPTMFDEAQGLFCFRVRQAGTTLTREGISHRYTMMTLLGIHRQMQRGDSVPIDTESVFQRVTAKTDWIENIGDLGLLLWLSAEAFPHHMERLHRVLDPAKALERYPGPRETMHLAWFLTGCSHLAIAAKSELPDTTDIAMAAYRDLIANQGACGAFRHLSSEGTITGLLRGRVGSFADQVYPIYALSRMAQAYEMGEPLSRALSCADVICGAQGPLGQWWWHYDAGKGSVLGRYPVYSVHQHAMGPMALFALQDVSKRDYSEPIYRGLEWIEHKNELGCDMRDGAAKLVWRCIRPTPSWLTYTEDAAAFLGVKSWPIGQLNLRVLRECRPYESGWLLYAFAGR